MLLQMAPYLQIIVLYLSIFNGYIVQHIHGTQGIDSQIINMINIVQAIPVLVEKHAGTEEWCFYKDLINLSNKSQTLCAEETIIMVGKKVERDLTEKE